MLRAKEKILVLVSIQILLIFSSFSLISYYENEKKDASLLVNIAGKNRFLALAVVHELDEFSREQVKADDVFMKIDELKNNVSLLQNGGEFIGIVIEPVPEKFLVDVNELDSICDNFQKTIENIIAVKSNGGIITDEIYFEHEQVEERMLLASNNLVNELSKHFDEISNLLVLFQYVLAPINILVYVVTIWLILKFLRDDSRHKAKLEKMATIGEMSARVAHDLRNPISVIKNSAELLNNDKLVDPKKTQSRIDAILRSANRINHQIDDIMGYVRTRPLKTTKKSLKEIISSAIKTTEMPNQIHVQLPDNDVEIESDSRQLEVLFSNLLSNSVQAIGESNGEIKFTIENGKNDFVKIILQDSGPGIPDEVLPKIFEPLFTTKTQGTGLGLVSCKNIIEQHGGTIQVFNNPTRFEIGLPINQK